MQSFFLGDPRGPYGYIKVTVHPGLCYRCGAEPMQHNSTVLLEGRSPGAACNAGAPSSRDIPFGPCFHPGTSDERLGSPRRAQVRGRSPPPHYSPSTGQDDGSPEDEQWLTDPPYTRLMDGLRRFPSFTGPIPGPSWFRPRGFSVEAYHSNITR